jgi:hypothetical protein
VAFCRRALSVLEKATDHELGLFVSDYDQWRRQAGSIVLCEGTTNPSAECPPMALPVELVWRTHMLHPRQYAQDKARLNAGEERHAVGLDLVQALRRQQAFMRRVVAAGALYEAPGMVTAAVKEYTSFLTRLRRTPDNKYLQPSLLEDLVWHTHQQCPARYASDCVQIVGRLVDHDDSPTHTHTQ